MVDGYGDHHINRGIYPPREFGPDYLKKKMQAEYENKTARLGFELDRQIKMISWARECLENEFMEGLGYKKMVLTEKDLKKLKELGETMSTAVNAKTRFDKSMKDLAASMTEEEEFESVITYLRSLPKEKIRSALARLKYTAEKSEEDERPLIISET